MKKVLFPVLAGLLMVTSVVKAQVAVTNTVSASPLTLQDQIKRLQNDIKVMEAKNVELAEENAKLEADVKKMKNQKNIFLGTTVATGAAAIVGGVTASKKSKDLKRAEIKVALAEKEKEAVSIGVDFEAKKPACASTYASEKKMNNLKSCLEEVKNIAIQ